MDPSTYTLDLSREEALQLKEKKEYLKAFTTEVKDEDATYETKIRTEQLICPVCKTAGARGPLTGGKKNLVRCRNVRCMMVYCGHCNKVDNHGPEGCEELARRRAANERFEPELGRTCPYAGCPGRGIQHYRNDGCHIVQCGVCGGSLCYVCGRAKRGGVHDATSGITCMCPLYCVDEHEARLRGIAKCPCVEDQRQTSEGVVMLAQDSEEEEDGLQVLRMEIRRARRRTSEE